MSKIKGLGEALQVVRDGDTVGFGGNTINRAPMAAVFALAATGRKNLHIIKTAGAMDVDVLCAAGCVASVDAGFISYESLGLAQYFRLGVQSGKLIMNEQSCYTVQSALRAAAYGIPFMPVKGLTGSGLLEECDYFAPVKSPFGDDTLACVRAIAPDVSIIHAHMCDRDGNTVIDGPLYDDILFNRASRHTIVTAESVVDELDIASPRDVVIPGFLVDAVVECKRGAWPCACYGLYDVDAEEIGRFKALEPDALGEYLMGVQSMRTGGRDD